MNLKKIFSFSLALILFLSSFSISAYAKDNLDDAVLGNVNLYISDSDKLEKIRAMKHNEIIYADANEIVKSLNINGNACDNYYIFMNSSKTVFMKLYYSSKKTDVTYIWRNNSDSFIKETSFNAIAETIKDDEHNAVWIPLRYTLALLNCDFLIDGEIVRTSYPKKTIFDIHNDWLAKEKYYRFDWDDDFGISEASAETMGKSAFVVTLMNGLLSLDSSSILESISCLNRDISGYDIKYGQDFTRLFVVPSAKELDEFSSQLDDVSDVFDYTSKTIDNINLTINELDNSVSNAAKLCEGYIEKINSVNGNIAEFNKSFFQLEKQANKEIKVLKNSKILRDIDDYVGFGEISDSLSFYTDILSIIAYAKEYSDQDELAVNSLEWFLNSGFSKEYIPDATINSCNSYLKTLDTNAVTYSTYRYFSENLTSILKDAYKMAGGKGIKSLIGSTANWELLVWDIVKNTVPFFKNGISNTDKMLLTTYLQCFQYTASKELNSISTTLFRHDKIDERYLNTYLSNWYCFFKTAYISRDAALGCNEDIPDFRKDFQNNINKEIAEQMAFIKTALMEDGKPVKCTGTIFGFIPSVRKALQKLYNETPVINVFIPVKEEYDITNYMTINNEGTDGNITVSYEWDVDAVNEFKELLQENHWLTNDECNKLFKSIEIEITPNTNLSEDDEITLICKYNTDFKDKGVYFIENLNLKVDGSKNHDMFFEYLENNNDGFNISPSVTEPNRVPTGFDFDYDENETGIIGVYFYDYDKDGYDEMVTISFLSEIESYIAKLTLDYFVNENGRVKHIDNYIVQSSESEIVSYAQNHIQKDSYLNYSNWFYSYEGQLGIMSEISLYLGGEFTSLYYISIENDEIILNDNYIYLYMSPVGDTFPGVYHLENSISNKVYYDKYSEIDNGYSEYQKDTANLFLYPDLFVGGESAKFGYTGCKRDKNAECICFFQEHNSLFEEKSNVIGTILYPQYNIDTLVENELYDWHWKNSNSKNYNGKNYYDQKEYIQEYNEFY